MASRFNPISYSRCLFGMGGDLAAVCYLIALPIYLLLIGLKVDGSLTSSWFIVTIPMFASVCVVYFLLVVTMKRLSSRNRLLKRFEFFFVTTLAANTLILMFVWVLARVMEGDITLSAQQVCGPLISLTVLQILYSFYKKTVA
eukprot:m.15063 g.15063  ORF g.15063 m.15063 type:complete len:143 (+) comp4408_c0_seq2:159-587(+)